MFLAAQLEQQRVAGPGCGQRAAARRPVQQHALDLRREPSGHDRAAPADRQPQVRHQRQRRHAACVRSWLPRRATLAEARQRYGEEYPDVKKLQRDIATLEARIKAGERGDVEMSDGTAVGMQLRTQINAIDSQLASIEAQNAALRAKLNGLEKNVTATPQVEREYANATRDLTIAREKYEQLLARQMDAEVSESAIVGGRADEFRLIQAPDAAGRAGQAAAPRHPAHRPGGRRWCWRLTATVAAEALDPKVRGARDVRELLSVSPLVAIPTIRNSRSRRRGAWRFAAATATRRHRRVGGIHGHPQLSSDRTSEHLAHRETSMSTTMEDAIRRNFAERRAAQNASANGRTPSSPRTCGSACAA